MTRDRFLISFALLLALTTSGSTAERAVLRAALSSITASDLQSHVDVLADDSFEGREAGSRGGRASAMYLMTQLEQRELSGMGDDGGYFQPFGRGCRNVLAMIGGSDPDLKDEVIVVGGHYDHVGYGTRANSYGPFGYVHNGADDNASGVAGILEVIDAFLRAELRPRRSILFAFWDGEEKGLVGSKHWVAQPTVPLDRVVAAINLDMIGRMKDNKLEVYGSRTARNLRRLVSESNWEALELDFTWEMKSNSDHYSFYSNKIPTLMFHTGLHDDYHRPSDDAHLINSDGMQRVARLLFQTVFTLSDQDELQGFRSACRDESPADRERMERPQPAAPPRLGIRWDPKGESGGLTLVDIRSGTPAARAGWHPGDRIVSFAGTRIPDFTAFHRAVLSAESPVEVELLRAGAAEPEEFRIELDGKPVRIGISWREDEAEPGTVFLTRVIPTSRADLAGLRVGDRVYEVRGRRFADGNELHEILTSVTEPFSLTIERRGRLQAIELSLGTP